jgi:hypothetical protein
MIDPGIPLTGRSLRFAPGLFSDMARTRDTAACTREAHAARAAAATSANPLLWAAVADRRAASGAAAGAGEEVLTGTAG